MCTCTCTYYIHARMTGRQTSSKVCTNEEVGKYVDRIQREDNRLANLPTAVIHLANMPFPPFIFKGPVHLFSPLLCPPLAPLRTSRCKLWGRRRKSCLAKFLAAWYDKSIGVPLSCVGRAKAVQKQPRLAPSARAGSSLLSVSVHLWVPPEGRHGDGRRYFQYTQYKQDSRESGITKNSCPPTYFLQLQTTMYY